ncbi:MAG: hypothetical protein EOO92_15235 [Pedobacter sp.]|nr:MAG: hypothetical protein EOO92_15235 [Pedobacter sp.]
MQKNTDSTLVLEFTSNWVGPPNLYIISKTAGLHNVFTYRSIAENRFGPIYLPSGIKAEMRSGSNRRIYSTTPSINEFFQPYPMKDKDVRILWSKMNAHKPWLLTDDSTNGEGCPTRKTEITKNGDTIVYDGRMYDGGGIRLYLITKDKVRFLDYYAPDYYEKECPGRKDRIAILTIGSLFSQNIL